MTTRGMLRFALALWLSTLSAFAQYYAGHAPATDRSASVFSYAWFSVGYSDETRTPLWSALEIRHAGEPVLGCTRVGRFATEHRADPPIDHKDYANREGYSRGHLTPNAVVAYVHGCEAAATTFITSNIVPQLQKHNAGVWEALESAIGGRATPSGFVPGLVQKAPEVWIYAGPVFWAAEPRKLGPKGIWIPDALWKTVIWKTADGATRTCSWLIPHRDDIPRGAFMSYVVSIRDIEEKVGVHLLGPGDRSLATEVDDQAFLDTVQ